MTTREIKAWDKCLYCANNLAHSMDVHKMALSWEEKLKENTITYTT